MRGSALSLVSFLTLAALPLWANADQDYGVLIISRERLEVGCLAGPANGQNRRRMPISHCRYLPRLVAVGGGACASGENSSVNGIRREGRP